MSLPAVDALKRAYPEAEITVLSLPYAAGLLALAPEVDHVLSFDVNLIRHPREVLRPANYRAFFALVRQLRASRFDVCLALHGKFACVLAWLSRSRETYGYRVEGYPLLLTRRLPGGRYRVRQHEVLYNLKLAEAAGASVDWSAVKGPHLLVPAAEQRRTRHLLAEFEIRPEQLLVVIHPGAANGSAKRWLPGHWSELANRLQRELGAAIILTGTASDGDIVQEVAVGCAVRPLILAGQTSIPQLGALLKRADLVLSSDSGPAHMAAALGVPQVTLFGPTDPVVYAPFGPKAVVLRRDLPCSPCYDATATAECRFGHVNCMRELLPDEVFQACLRLLAKRRGGQGLGVR
jgi:lipopolysaccharide heptosyltransferase II